jgi:hypothetical protein
VTYPQGYQPPPQPPTRKLSTGAIVAIVIGAVIVVMCGICTIGAIANGALTGAESAAASSEGRPAVVATKATTPSLKAAPTASPTPTMLTVPNDLVGSNALIAHERLVELGFTKISYGSEDPYDTLVILPQNWRVTKVEPIAGSSVPADATIVLTCTKRSSGVLQRSEVKETPPGGAVGLQGLGGL